MGPLGPLWLIRTIKAAIFFLVLAALIAADGPLIADWHDHPERTEGPLGQVIRRFQILGDTRGVVGMGVLVTVVGLAWAARRPTPAPGDDPRGWLARVCERPGLRWAVLFWLAVLACAGTANLSKLAIPRCRPDRFVNTWEQAPAPRAITLEQAGWASFWGTGGPSSIGLRHRVGGAETTSFPSSHTAVAVAMVATLAWPLRGRWLAHALVVVVGLLVAMAVGAARVYTLSHYPSDVWAGACVGWLTALLVITLEARANRRITRWPGEPPPPPPATAPRGLPGR